MIENMRKYTGLMVVVLVLLAAGLILTMGNFNANSGGRGKVTEVYGEGIDQIQFRKMGFNSLGVIKQLQDPGLTGYALDMIYNRQLDMYAQFGFYRMGTSTQDAQRFVTRRIVVAKTAAEYGIYPSTEQAKKHIKEQMFAQDGNFNAASYQAFIKEIGSSGLQEEDFVNLVAESLVYDRLKNLISSGLQSPNNLTARSIKFQQQTLDLTSIAIDIDRYKKEIKPTEEEIKAYWTENDFKYLTDRTIRISYIVERPVYSTPRPVAPVRAADATDEEFAKIDEAFQAELAKWELEVEKPADNLVAAKLDDLAYLVDNSDGLKFEEEITNKGLKLTSTELFSTKDVPADLKLLNSKDGDSIADRVFQIKISDSLKYRIPAPIKLEGNGWFYVRYDEEMKPVTKTYEEAKELAKADYIQDKAHTAMIEDVKNLKEKLAKSIADGTSAEDAAESIDLEADVRTGVTYANLGKDINGQITGSEYEIFENATITSNKSFSEKNIEEDDQVILVYLHKREVVDTAEAVDMRVRIQNARSEMLQDSVFRAWMDDAVTKANIPAMEFE
ncbi:MAG: SurA N-terminal domain-containing protein [Akkermansiaceae bacterium]